MSELPTLPDEDFLLVEILATITPDGTSIGTQMPDHVLNDLPFVAAHAFGGPDVDDRFLTRATVTVDVWAATRKAASDIARGIRTGLRDAVRNQTVYDNGHLSRRDVISAPSELRTPERADNVWRFNATYSLVLRPASTPL